MNYNQLIDKLSDLSSRILVPKGEAQVALQEAKDAIIALTDDANKEANAWIDARKELPDNTRDVLVGVKSKGGTVRPAIAYCNEEGVWSITKGEVVCWMDIPTL